VPRHSKRHEVVARVNTNGSGKVGIRLGKSTKSIFARRQMVKVSSITGTIGA
jgi:hypothetical protein